MLQQMLFGRTRSVAAAVYIFHRGSGIVTPSSFSHFLLVLHLLRLPYSIAATTKLDTSISMGKKVGAMKTKRGGKEKATDADDVSLKKVDCD